MLSRKESLRERLLDRDRFDGLVHSFEREKGAWQVSGSLEKAVHESVGQQAIILITGRFGIHGFACQKR